MGFLLAVGALQIWNAVTGYHPYARERKPVTPPMPDRVSRFAEGFSPHPQLGERTQWGIAYVRASAAIYSARAGARGGT